MSTKKFFTFVAFLVIASLMLVACGPTPAEVCGDRPVDSYNKETGEVQCSRIEVPMTEANVAPEATEAPTEAPAQPTTVSAYCGQARDLGPWAPSNGVGETFEVTATKNDSAGIVLGLWIPAGNTPWGQKEITTFVEPGLSIEVQAGAGRGFDYPVGCSATEVDSQMAAHIVQRKQDTTYNGYVDVDELIRLGLVVVRFDRRGQ